VVPLQDLNRDFWFLFLLCWPLLSFPSQFRCNHFVFGPLHATEYLVSVSPTVPLGSSPPACFQVFQCSFRSRWLLLAVCLAQDFLTGLLILLIFSPIFTACDFLFSGWTPVVTLLSLDLARAWWVLFVPVCWPRNSFSDLCARLLGSQSALAPDFHFPARSQLSRRANR
jgi:hypothetical protein